MQYMQKRLQATATSLAAIEIWLVTAMVAASVISERLLPLTLGVAGAFWIVRWFGTGRISVSTPADRAILLLVLMIPVSMWATIVPDTSGPQVARLLTGIALYYMIVNWAIFDNRLELVHAGLILSGIVLSVAAPFTVTWTLGKVPFIPNSFYRHFTLLVADTINPSVLGGALIILLPCSLAILLFQGRQLGLLKGSLVGLAAIIMSVVVVFTQSRGSWIGLGAALTALAHLRWRRGWLFLVAAMLISAISLWSMDISNVLNVVANDRTFGGVQGRIEIWRRAVYIIQHFPFTGTGVGSFGNVTDLIYPFFIPSWNIPHAHNIFLQVAVDLGIPGLTAWLAIIMLVIAKSWQVYRHGCDTHDGLKSGLGAGLLCSQVALVVHGLTDAVTWGMVRTAVIPWALWGLAIACWNVYVQGARHRFVSEEPDVEGIIESV